MASKQEHYNSKAINEIVAGEETDENEDGRPMSHFEMYLDSIESFGVKTDIILNNINSLNSLDTIDNNIEKLEIKDYIKDFLKFTFSVINKGKIQKLLQCLLLAEKILFQICSCRS